MSQVTLFEIVSVCVALLALIISLLTLSEHRKLQKQSIELQKKTAELSDMQIEMFKKDAFAQKRAELRLVLERGSQGNHFLRITNHGPAHATNINLTAVSGQFTEKLIGHSDTRARLPLTRIRPGETVSLHANVFMEFKGDACVRLTWQDEIGEQSEDQQLRF